MYSVTTVPTIVQPFLNDMLRNGDLSIVHHPQDTPQSNDQAERCVQAIKSAIKKATSSNGDLDMVLICLRSTPIDYTIPSPGELLFNRKLIENLPVKCLNNLALKEKIAILLYQRQPDKISQHDKHVSDLPSLLVGQRIRVLDQGTSKWSSAVVT